MLKENGEWLLIDTEGQIIKSLGNIKHVKSYGDGYYAYTTTAIDQPTTFNGRWGVYRQQR